MQRPNNVNVKRDERYPSQRVQKSPDTDLASGWKRIIMDLSDDGDDADLLVRLLSEEDIERSQLEGCICSSSEKETSSQPTPLSSVNLLTKDIN